jgi:hypothetical protein
MKTWVEQTDRLFWADWHRQQEEEFIFIGRLIAKRRDEEEQQTDN